MLEAIHITRSVAGKRLINDVSLTVHPGERIGITGPTGSGKTVLLRALAILDPVNAGTIRWRGESVAGHDIPVFRSCVMYLSQRPALSEGTVEENLQLPFTLDSHRGRNYSRDAVVAFLKQAGRESAFLDRSVRELSGGELQIVALIRAIQLEPAMLLLDEPTASLDSDSAARIESLTLRWCDADPERSLIWVSHHQPQVTQLADRLLRMEHGRLSEVSVERTSPDEHMETTGS